MPVLKICYEQVLIRMGANKYKTKVDSKNEKAILESIEFVEKILKPQHTTAFATKKVTDNKIYLDDFIINSKDILKLLENCNLVYGLVATIGKEFDNKINSLLEDKQVYLSYIYDSIGSVAIETYINKICNDIKAKYNKTTMRFSPGYGDWTIDNQKNFLEWLGAQKIGITLSSTYQMSPRKSVSAIFGVCE
jgi:hypothetical protein